MPNVDPDQFRDRTAGNPLFMLELLKEMVASGQAEGAHSETVLKSGALPKGIQSVLERRLNRLDDNCRKLLAAAAVIGANFRWDVLCAVSGEDEDDLLDMVRGRPRDIRPEFIQTIEGYGIEPSVTE